MLLIDLLPMYVLNYLDSEIHALPMVLLVGPWGTGKTTAIKYLIGGDEFQSEFYIGESHQQSCVKSARCSSLMQFLVFGRGTAQGRSLPCVSIWGKRLEGGRDGAQLQLGLCQSAEIRNGFRQSIPCFQASIATPQKGLVLSLSAHKERGQGHCVFLDSFILLLLIYTYV